MKSPNNLSLTVPENVSDMRLDTCLTQHLPEYSRSFYQDLIKKGNITLNDQIITKPKTEVQPGDTIHITLPEKRSYEPEDVQERVKKSDIHVDVIAENKDFLIINKPAGLVVHAPSEKSTEITLVDWLLAHYPELAAVGNNNRPGIVHRLDKDTSGLMVIPRTPHAHHLLSRMFHDRKVTKKYLAIVTGHPNPTGVIDLPIGRHTGGTKMATYATVTPRTPRTRNATTEYTVLHYYPDSSVIEARPITGRTHQIRVHLKSIGHPLVGDIMYGQKSKFIKRHALHAHSIAFTFDGKDYSFTQEPPEDFQKLIKQLGKELEYQK